MFVLYVTKCWIVLSSFTQSVQGNLNSPPSRSLQIFPPIDKVLRAQKIYLWLLSLLYLGGMGVPPPKQNQLLLYRDFILTNPSCLTIHIYPYIRWQHLLLGQKLHRKCFRIQQDGAASESSSSRLGIVRIFSFS